MAALRGLASVIALAFLSACATADETHVSSPSDVDAFNESIEEINRTWEEFRVSGNACNVADGPCFETAISSSGFEEAATELQSTVRSLEATVQPGECRFTLAAFDETLQDLLESLETLRADARAADASGVEVSAPTVRSAWDAAVAAQGKTEVCFSGGFAER